jgi:LCP family protein required for cell wall assembly
MIITVNPKTHQILMTGIPRDFYIPQVCQGNQKDKLTHTGLYGVDCTVQSMENYTGLDINYYARVNFSSVVDIVDALGGIQVWSDVAFTAGAGGYSYVAGLNDLNGAETLGFVRERHSFGDGDRERSRNQMKVVEAMINKAISPAIIKNFSGIMDAVAGSFQTNMSQSDITKFVKNQIASMEGWDIMQIQVNGTGQSLYSPANGGNAYMMVPNVDIVNSAVALIEKMQTGVELTQEDIDAHMYVYNNGGY